MKNVQPYDRNAPVLRCQTGLLPNSALRKHTTKNPELIENSNSMVKYFLPFLVLATCCSCTSAKPNPSYTPSVDKSEYKRIIDAQTNLFAEEISLVSEIDLLTNHPGWEDFVPIIKSIPSITYLEGQAAALKTSQMAINSWSEKWHAPGDELYKRYLALVARSKTLHAKRVGLYNQELTWVESYYSDGLKETALVKDISISTRMEERERAFRDRSLQRAHLMNNLLGISPLGLYERKVSQEEFRRRLAAP